MDRVTSQQDRETEQKQQQEELQVGRWSYAGLEWAQSVKVALTELVGD